MPGRGLAGGVPPPEGSGGSASCCGGDPLAVVDGDAQQGFEKLVGQRLAGRAHAETGVGLDRAVVVRAAGGDQSVLLGQGQAALHRGLVVQRVVALDAGQAQARRLSHDALQAGLVGADDAGVGEHGERAGGAQQADGGGQRHPLPVHPGRRAAPQEAVEGLADGRHVATAAQGLADVGPSDGPVLGERARSAASSG